MYYFDWAATTPISGNALKTYVDLSENVYGNPSSEHPLGIQAAEKLSAYRKNLAGLLNIKPSELFFTAGGTEGDSIILSSLLWAITPGEVVIGKTEHSAILGFIPLLKKQGWTVRKADPEHIEKYINEKTRLILIMSVNNVTGQYYDIKGIAEIIRKKEKEFNRHIHFHTDAVQAVGKTLFDLKETGVDSAAISAHKFQGPRGTGILYNKNLSFQPLSPGGGQENRFRPGTENLPAIGAMNTALQEAYDNSEKNMLNAQQNKAYLKDILIKNKFIINSPVASSPYILSVSAPGVPSQVFLRIMSDKGFCLSAGSACSANQKGKAESVLAAMGINPQNRMSVFRISTGFKTTKNQCEKLAEALISTYKEFGR